MNSTVDFEAEIQRCRTWRSSVEQPFPGGHADVAAVLAGAKPCAIIMPMDRRELKPWLDYARAQAVYVRNFRPSGCGYYTVVGDKSSCDALVDVWLFLFEEAVTKEEMAECDIQIGRCLGFPVPAIVDYINRRHPDVDHSQLTLWDATGNLIG